MVKLTVVHDGFAPGSAVLEGVRGGWPAVIASLKTLLETGSSVAVGLAPVGSLRSLAAGLALARRGGQPPCHGAGLSE